MRTEQLESIAPLQLADAVEQPHQVGVRRCPLVDEVRDRPRVDAEVHVAVSPVAVADLDSDVGSRQLEVRYLALDVCVR